MMALEPPRHEPEDRVAKRRDLGHVLVLVGYIMVVADLIIGAYVFAALRGEGGRIALIVIALDAVLAVALIAIGYSMKKRVAPRSDERIG